MKHRYIFDEVSEPQLKYLAGGFGADSLLVRQQRGREMLRGCSRTSWAMRENCESSIWAALGCHLGRMLARIDRC